MSLETEIEAKLASNSSPFAIFDFDNTCIVNDIGEATFAYVCRHKLLKDTTLIESADGDYHEAVFRKYYEMYSSGDVKAAYLLNAQMFSGFTSEEAGAIVQKVLEEEGSEIQKTELYGVSVNKGLALRSHVIELMQFLKSHTVTIWLVSASNEICVKVAMDHFGISEDLIGVRLVEADGKFTKEFEYPIPVIEGKVECMRKYIDPSANPLLVIDDSTTGLPILETAAIPVAVGRNNALTREAEKRGWHVI